VVFSYFRKKVEPYRKPYYQCLKFLKKIEIVQKLRFLDISEKSINVVVLIVLIFFQFKFHFPHTSSIKTNVTNPATKGTLNANSIPQPADVLKVRLFISKDPLMATLATTS